MNSGPRLQDALTSANMMAAWRKVAENRGMAGVDRETIDELEPQLHTVLNDLATQVTSGQYRPAPLLRVWIPRPGRAPRGLAVPTVRDRILQCSVTLALNPAVEAELEDCAFAYRRGRGVRQAVARIGTYQRQGYRWVVDADIERFFDTVPHDGLLTRLAEVAPDPGLLALVRSWLKAPIDESGQLTHPEQGIPQGSPISPLLANLYLDTLDEALLDEDHILVRYADDFIVLARTQARAEAALELTETVLERLALRLNPLKTRIVNLDDGLEFLGWHFVRSFSVPRRWPTEAASPPPDTLHVGTARAPSSTITTSSPPKAANLAEPSASDVPPPTDAPQKPADDDELPPLAPLQRTLYLVDTGASLSVDNQRYRIERDGKPILTLPAGNVDAILLFGNIPVTTPALQLAARQGCPVAYLSSLGRCYGRFEPAGHDGAPILQAQFARHADQTFGLGIVRALVSTKLSHSALVLARTSRHHPEAATEVPERLRQLTTGLHGAADVASLRGTEGAAAAAYWSAFTALMPSGWTFSRRQAHPAPDAINALLSLGYTLLYNAVGGLLQARGLNAHLGWLHVPGSRHLALASDLMECYRAYVVDATLLHLLHAGDLDPADHRCDDGQCQLGPETVRSFIRAIEARFNAVQQHPQCGTPMDLRRIIDRDVLSLITSLRTGDPADFSPTRWR